MTFSYGSVCSGIEAATCAWHVLGARAAWFAEIEKFPAQVLAHHYPNVPNMGDMTKIAQYIRLGLLEAPDVLVGGTPCQAFSVAGLRAGLADPRGQLTLSFVDLANAIDEKRSGTECTVVWENVPGVLSDKSNAFGCFLGYLAGEDDALVPPGKSWPNAGVVYGPQRAIAWRVLDAQYFGVAQRRRRVFLVASARSGFDPASILFEFNGVRRDSPPSRETGQEIAGTISSRTSGGGGLGTDFECAGGLQAVTATLDASYGRLQGASGQDANHGHSHLVPVAFGGNNQSGPIHVATARNASSSSSGRLDFESETFVVAHVNVLPTMRSGNPNGGAAHGARSGDTKDEYIVPVCVTGAVTHCLKATGFDASEDRTGRGQPIVAVFAENSRGELRYEGGDGQRAGALSTGGGKPGQGTPTVQVGMAVRRLVPHECERLQAFEDHYTRIPLRNKKGKLTGKYAKDGPRYKALGNSMCVFVMRWIGRRIIY